MPSTVEPTSAVDQQLLLQLGARLRRARLQQVLSTVQMAERAGLSRMTLRVVEAGEPTPSLGSYLRVMRVLGVSQDLALLVSDHERPAPSAALTRTRRKTTGTSGITTAHELQDLQSLVLHQEAVRLMKQQPELIQRALDTLHRWRSKGSSSTQLLWDEWSVILQRRIWRRALAHTQRSKELRQASPLATVLPSESRRRILEEVRLLRSEVQGA